MRRLLEFVAMTRFVRFALLALALALPVSAGAQTVRVFAASSLTDAFTVLAQHYQATHPGVHVALDFAASSTLATQILQGAPADIFASANPIQMKRVTDAGLQLGPATPFAGNRLVILTPSGSDLHTFRDLATPGLLLVLAAPQVPAGHYADEMLAAAARSYGAAFVAAVRSNVVSREPNVRQTAAKVALGAADAAIVYATDARGLTGTRSVIIPAALQPTIVYPLVALKSGGQTRAAQAFRAFVLSPAGRAALASYGFTPPP